ncbi:hypothetical protein IBX35_01655 [Candidatus Bathyarchaeota archaeon]|nr:hypothetical protein [Candidatus Bathyarchaeota archaeon]
MKKAKTKMKSQSFTCSNPECERVFANPIIVQNLSSKNESSYSACPYCLTEIVIETNSEVEEEKRTVKKKRAKIEEPIAQPTKLKPAEQLSLKDNKCPYHFGYLSQRSRKEEIPEECMTCEKIVQCMLKKVTG